MPTKATSLGADIIQRPYGKLVRLTSEDGILKQMTVNETTIDPGKQTSKHSHPQDELWYIISGRGIVHGINQMFEVSAGDTILIAPGEVHQLSNKSQDDPLTYLIVMSPPRDSASITYYS